MQSYLNQFIIYIFLAAILPCYLNSTQKNNYIFFRELNKIPTKHFHFYLQVTHHPKNLNRATSVG